MGEKSNENIVCPVPVKPVDFARMGLEQLQPPQRRHRLPQSSRMPPMDQQQQQKQMLANQSHWVQLERQTRQIAYYRQKLTEGGGWQHMQPFWEQALMRSPQSQQGQQHEQEHQAQLQQVQQHEQGVAEFGAHVVRTHEIIPLMAPGPRGDCPEDAAMQLELQFPHFDEAQQQQALQEFELFPSPSMETLPDNWEQQPQFQTNSEGIHDEEPFQFFNPQRRSDELGGATPTPSTGCCSAAHLPHAGNT